jgi:hypothetical protein
MIYDASPYFLEENDAPSNGHLEILFALAISSDISFYLTR